MEQHPALFDTNNDGYKLIEVRNRHWDEIAAGLGQPGKLNINYYFIETFFFQSNLFEHVGKRCAIVSKKNIENIKIMLKLFGHILKICYIYYLLFEIVHGIFFVLDEKVYQWSFLKNFLIGFESRHLSIIFFSH